MTHDDALKVIDKATQPMVAGNISRAGYVEINTAIGVLAEAVKELANLKKGAAHPEKP